MQLASEFVITLLVLNQPLQVARRTAATTAATRATHAVRFFDDVQVPGF